MPACPPRRFPTPLPAPHMIRIWKWERKPSIWLRHGCGRGRRHRETPVGDTLRSAFWKIHSPFLDFLAGWPRRRQGFAVPGLGLGGPGVAGGLQDHISVRFFLLHRPPSQLLVLGAASPRAGATFGLPRPHPSFQDSSRPGMALSGRWLSGLLRAN